MSTVSYARLSSQPLTALPRRITIFDKLVVSKQLAFNMEAQPQSNWCWAATAKSVSHFYWFFSPWTQCKIVNAELGRSDCCNSTVPSPCNEPWYLDRALTRTNNYVSMTGAVTFDQVRAEIDAGRPVGARIGWSGNGGHFMVIYGYSHVFITGQSYFDIDDPIYGKSHLRVSEFSSNYQGSGTWTHTYFTKSYFKLPIKVLYPKPKILERIWEERPMLRLKTLDAPSLDPRELVSDRDASIGMAHRVFNVGLDSLTSDRPAFQPVGLRVYETVGDTPKAFYDVTDDDDPRVMSMSASAQHLEPLAQALSQALTLAEQRPQETEVRLLRVPALNFEGLWLAGDTEDGDQIVPLRPVGRLAVNQPVPLREAIAALREAARPLQKMDDTMGA
jgi:hypothetical protein